MGWIVLGILLAIYLIVKFQTWLFVHQTRALERQLEALRPALSAIALSKQLNQTVQAYQQAVHQIRSHDAFGLAWIETLTRLPASITLDRVEVTRHGAYLVGSLTPGVRSPEAVLVRWVQTLMDLGTRATVSRLVPDEDEADRWLFEVQLSRGRE